MKRFGLTINFRKSRLNSARNGCPFKNTESGEKSGEAPETPTILISQPGPRWKGRGTKADRNFAQGGHRVYRGDWNRDSKERGHLSPVWEDSS
jgi:hypothetical protein